MTTAPSTLLDRIDELCREGESSAAGTPLVDEFRAIARRAHGPLRVAIAGRVKAGKSTLLNALVGEQVAPTDAGECTRVVTWYSYGITYDVRARLIDGAMRSLTFRREDGRFEIDLGDLTTEMIDRIEVTWPSSRLQAMTLIDTPGLASLDDRTSLRTRDFLALEEDGPSEADAVIYLLRHMHSRDTQFLEAFIDRSVANASPVNAIALLSRADEVGAARPAAMQSAAHIAQRYAEDERVRALVVGVLPVAGLLAETGNTLREHEAAALRELADLDEELRERMLRSADAFVSPDLSRLAPEIRHDLLMRLGMFGVRLAITEMRQGHIQTASELARLLLDISGIAALRNVLDNHLAVRAQALKARTGLAAVRAAARRLSAAQPEAGARLLDHIERVEASSHELAEMRLVHLMLAGMVQFTEAEQHEVERLTGEGAPARRLGLPDDADDAAMQVAALKGVDAWRRRGANPLANRELRDAYEILARSYEGIYASLV